MNSYVFLFPCTHLTAPNGFRIFGANESRLGYSLSFVGDVNNDGFDDFIVGAPLQSSLNRTHNGVVYVIQGSASGASDIDLASPLSRSRAGVVVIHGPENDSFLGVSVGAAGDVNGDGYADFNIKTSTGNVYVIFGVASFQVSIDLAVEQSKSI